MPPVDALAEKLETLLLQGALPASRLGRGDRTRLQALFDAGVLQQVRSGAGLRVVVQQPATLRAFAEKTYPSGLRCEGDALPARARAVAQLRDSKKGKGRCPATVLLRGFGGCRLAADSTTLAVADWTAQAGVAAVALDRIVHWGFSGTLAIVENLELFWNIEQISPEVELALYAQGRLTQRLLKWLASPSMQSARVMHFGDFDPVGLDEYLRLKQACPERSALYRPDNLEDLFRKYSKPRLLTDNTAIMNRLRKVDDPEVSSIVKLIDRFGGGLEQEALLIEKFT